jgi:crotonobetainyl-CoA:carnitine CoA-transferase CaiB-like acyl-CoA transferase
MLSAYRIVELGAYVAAPAVAGILADWGADVVKVESDRGDPIRWQRPGAAPGDSSPNFEFDNRGKRSIVIDYRTAEGREVLDRLLATADVFITNIRPGSLKRAGLDYETVSAAYPRLVYTSITGYGLEGEAVDTPAFDITAFWSRSGLNGQLWPQGSQPLTSRPGVGDHITALAAALGTVTALLDRVATGRGRLVEASLLRAGTYTGGFDLAERIRRGETHPTRERLAPDAGPNSYFPVADGRWICVWAHDQVGDWPKIYAAAGCAGLGQDPRFLSAEGRAAHGAELNRALDAGFGALTLAQAGERLTASNIIWSPVLIAPEVLDDPLVSAAGCFVEVEDGAGGRYRSPAPPVRLAGGDGAKRPPPRVGEHTDAILAELGFDAEQCAAARRAGAVA